MPHGLQEAGLLVQPLLPELATLEQAAAFPRCQAAHVWGVLRLGQGGGEGEDGARFLDLCPHPGMC